MMFSALKFVVAGAIVALFGGLLLVGLPSVVPDEPVAPATQTSPSSSPSVSGTVTAEMPVAAGQRLVVTVGGLPGRGSDEPLGRYEVAIEQDGCGLQVPFAFEVDAPTGASCPHYAEGRLEDPEGGETVGRSRLPSLVKLDSGATEPVALELIDELRASGRNLHWPGTLRSSVELPDGVDDVSYIVSLVERGARDEPNIAVAEVVVCGVTDLSAPTGHEMRWDAEDIKEDAQYGVEARVVTGLDGDLLGRLQVERWMLPFDFNYEGTDDPAEAPGILRDILIPAVDAPEA